MSKAETILTQPRPALPIGQAPGLSEKKAKPPTPHILPFAQLLSHRGVKNSATAHALTGASFPRATVELRLGDRIIHLLAYYLPVFSSFLLGSSSSSPTSLPPSTPSSSPSLDIATSARRDVREIPSTRYTNTSPVELASRAQMRH